MAEVDPKRLSNEVLQTEITKWGLALGQDGFLPNGLQQLVFGSIAYRPATLFMETGANEGKYRDDAGFDELWKNWRKEYDPFT